MDVGLATHDIITDSTRNAEEALTKQQQKNKKKREATKKKKQDAKKEESVTDKLPASHNSMQSVKGEEQVEADNFEEELCWCINQLEIGLKTQKPTKDQVSNNSKLLNQLRSQKTPKAKKRMLMRTTFGNYREKMAKEVKNCHQVAPKLVEVNESVLKQSTFLRQKIHDLSDVANEKINKEVFRFDFPDPT